MKKRGFTLIELLAVIVVLAIIALIATPIVMNVIKKANMGAAERSADNYLKAVELLISTNQLDGEPIVDGTYTIDSTGKLTKDGKEYEVEVSGTKPVGGKITFEGGEVVKASASINYDDYLVKFDNGKAEAIELVILSDVCNLQSGNKGEVGSKYTCNLGDKNRTFYVLETGKNPTSNSTLRSNQVALILEGNYTMDTLSWCDQNGQNPSDNICAADGLEAKLDDIVKNTWIKLDRSQIGLPSMEQIMVADGKLEDSYLSNQSIRSNWLYDDPNFPEYGEGTGTRPVAYWTSTTRAVETDRAWRVNYNGYLDTGYVYGSNYVCLRPIIIISI